MEIYSRDNVTNVENIATQRYIVGETAIKETTTEMKTITEISDSMYNEKMQKKRTPGC